MYDQDGLLVDECVDVDLQVKDAQFEEAQEAYLHKMDALQFHAEHDSNICPLCGGRMYFNYSLEMMVCYRCEEEDQEEVMRSEMEREMNR